MWNQFYVFQLVRFFMLDVSKTKVNVSLGHPYLKYAPIRNHTKLCKRDGDCQPGGGEYVGASSECG